MRQTFQNYGTKISRGKKTTLKQIFATQWKQIKTKKKGQIKECEKKNNDKMV